jgi:hypothetical protein
MNNGIKNHSQVILADNDLTHIFCILDDDLTASLIRKDNNKAILSARFDLSTERGPIIRRVMSVQAMSRSSDYADQHLLSGVTDDFLLTISRHFAADLIFDHEFLRRVGAHFVKTRLSAAIARGDVVEFSFYRNNQSARTQSELDTHFFTWQNSTNEAKGRARVTTPPAGPFITA